MKDLTVGILKRDVPERSLAQSHQLNLQLINFRRKKRYRRRLTKIKLPVLGYSIKL